jgi:cell surface protein SprA
VSNISAKLADVGNVRLTGHKSTPGFGGLDSRIHQRSLEDVFQYDIMASLELGKFIPTKTIVNIPLQVQYAETRVTPQYNPLDPDILMKDALKRDNSKQVNDSLSGISQSYDRRKSINLRNVKLNRPDGKKAKLYSLSNWSVSYLHNDNTSKNINIVNKEVRRHYGSVNYYYSRSSDMWRPFNESESLERPIYRIIRDINFAYEPTSLEFRTNINRSYSEMSLRDVSFNYINIPTVFRKNFTWNRDFDIKWDLTESLKFDFTSGNRARIDEPEGRIHRSEPDYREKRDSIWNNLIGFGRNTAYHHNYLVNYTLPINKIPWFNWITLNSGLEADYDWKAGPITADTIELGNQIENSRRMLINGRFDFRRLYSQLDFLKVNRDEGKKKVGDFMLEFISGLKTFDFDYNWATGTYLPGFLPESQLLGMNFNQAASSPGFAFITGFQNTDIGDRSVEYGWLTRDSLMIEPMYINQNENLRLKADLIPFKGLRVIVDMNYVANQNLEQFYRSGEFDVFNAKNKRISGNLSMSFLSFATAFEKFESEGNRSRSWDRFLSNREVISQRMGEDRLENQIAGSPHYDPSTGDNVDYADGYGPTSQEVLVPSFLAAYSGIDAEKSRLPGLPGLFDFMPNWDIVYNGSFRNGFISEIISGIKLHHKYISSYTVNSYSTNLLYEPDQLDGMNYVRDFQGNFLPEYEFRSISINEIFSPLIQIDIQSPKSFSASFGIDRRRDLILSLSNNQLMEGRISDIRIGARYTFSDVPLLIGRSGRPSKNYQSDLRFILDLVINDNSMLIRKLDEAEGLMTKGVRKYQVDTEFNYRLSNIISLKIFYHGNILRPHVSNTISFNTTFTKVGFGLTINLNERMGRRVKAG